MKQEKAKRLIQFTLLSTLFVWSAFSYFELFKFMRNGILFARLIDGRPYVSDFANTYNAGTLAFKCLGEKGEKPNIYDVKVQDLSLKKIVAPVVPEQPFYLQYPPYFFFLALPTALLSINLAWLGWNLIGILLSCLSLVLLYSLSGEKSSRQKALLLGLVFSSYPAWLSVELGQTSLYLVPSLAFMLYFLKKQKRFLAGLCAGFLCIKLQYAPLLLLFGLCLGALPFFAGCFSCLLLLLLGSYFCLGYENIVAFPQALVSAETTNVVSGVSSYLMQNLRGQLVLFLHEEGPILKGLVISFYVIALAFVCFASLKCRQKWQLDDSVFYSTAALVCALSLVSSPHTHIQDYLLLALSYVALSQTSAGQTRFLKNMFVFLPAFSWLFFFLQAPFLFIGLQPYFIYALALIALIMRWRGLNCARSEPKP